MLAHRLMSSGRADGIYVALPTMATANAMFDRLARTYRRLFGSRAEPSIALAHGARGMHDGFRDAVIRGGRFEADYSSERDSSGEWETTASAACAAWIADDRRRSFLADVGAGTIDQAVLSILPTRHQSLRLLGVLRRVLVLDEIHAYDAYMQSEIERLIEFQAGLGGYVILLSATLPASIRTRLAEAFRKGVARDAADLVTSSEYPLATVCTRDGDACMPIAGVVDRARRLPVRFLRSVDEAYREVAAAAEVGHSVLYLRNTVDDALDAYRELTNRGLQAQLFHARFALDDRLKIEHRVLATFGKYSTPRAAQRQCPRRHPSRRAVARSRFRRDGDRPCANRPVNPACGAALAPQASRPHGRSGDARGRPGARGASGRYLVQRTVSPRRFRLQEPRRAVDDCKGPGGKRGDRESRRVANAR